MQCNCEQCRKMCLGLPGWFMPGQVTLAAAFLGLSVPEFFAQYLIVEYWVGSPDIDVLAPRRIDQEGLSRARWNDSFRNAACKLLGPAGCRLPHDLRPVECSTSYACGEGCANDPRLIDREEIKDCWEAYPEELRQCRVSS